MINLYINERRIGDVTVLDLKGRVRVGGSTVALHRSVRSLVVEKKTRILLNLTDVTYVDSCGLGELVASQVSLEAIGGKLKLVGISDSLRELLSVARLNTVFDTYTNEAEAIQGFADNDLRPERPQLAFA